LQALPQTPPVHVALPLAGTGHATQPAPQCVASSPVERQVPAQLLRGEGHAHAPDWHRIPPLHALVQLPQWASSVARFEHDPEHSVVPAGQPEVQA
jgi:hypothetical protein